MFRKNKLLNVTISTEKENLRELIQMIQSVPNFKLIESKDIIVTSKNAQGLRKNVQLTKEYENLLNFLQLHEIKTKEKTTGKFDKDLEKNFEIISNFKNKYEAFDQAIENIKSEMNRIEKRISILKKLKTLDISLEQIFECEFLVARIGKITSENRKKIKYYRNLPFIFEVLSEENNVCWCLYATSNYYERQVDNIFSSLLFERIYLPGKIQELPKKAITILEKELVKNEKEILKIRKEQKVFVKQELEILSETKNFLEQEESYNKIFPYIIDYDKRVSVSGYIDETKVNQIYDLVTNDKMNILALPALKKEVKILKKKYKNIK